MTVTNKDVYAIIALNKDEYLRENIELLKSIAERHNLELKETIGKEPNGEIEPTFFIKDIEFRQFLSLLRIFDQERGIYAIGDNFALYTKTGRCVGHTNNFKIFQEQPEEPFTKVNKDQYLVIRF